VTVIDVESIAVHGSDSETHKIESVLAAAQVPDDHFVPVKGTGNIVVEATITPNTEETRGKLTWSPSPPMVIDATNRKKAKQSRATAGKYTGTVNVSGKTARRFNNWVVWSTCSTPTFSWSTGSGTVETGDGTSGPGQYFRYTVTSGFTFTISPNTICTDSDRPNLEGSHSGNVPGGTQKHVTTGDYLSGGAGVKWDESRRIRVKLLNPHLYTKNQLPKVGGHMFDGQPAATDVPEDYPTAGSVIGNDDRRTDDEDNNPYSTNIGKLTGSDTVQFVMRNSTGADNDTFEVRFHFGEFARLELGTTWYYINDDFNDWRTHFKIKRVSGAWTNNGSSSAADNTGWE
jgi:hypothetical protein